MIRVLLPMLTPGLYGGANAKTGETFLGCIFLEWVIPFESNPCAGEWGRNVYTNGVLRSDFRVEKGWLLMASWAPPDELTPTTKTQYILRKRDIHAYDRPWQYTS